MKQEHIGECCAELEEAFPGTVTGYHWDTHRGWVIVVVDVASGEERARYSSLAAAKEAVKQAREVTA